MSLIDDLMKSVRESLPEMVAGQMLDVLKKAKADAERVESYAQIIERQDKELSRLQKYEEQSREFDRRELELKRERIAVEDAKRDQKHRDEVIRLKEEHAADMVAIMRDVVRDVFSNSRLKYREYGTVPVALPGLPGSEGTYQCPQSPMVADGRVDKTVETEGG